MQCDKIDRMCWARLGWANDNPVTSSLAPETKLLTILPKKALKALKKNTIQKRKYKICPDEKYQFMDNVR